MSAAGTGLRGVRRAGIGDLPCRRACGGGGWDELARGFSLIGGGRGIPHPRLSSCRERTRSDADIAIVAAPRAPAGSGDPSRRWTLAFPDGIERFAGVTRLEGEAVVPALAALGADRWEGALVEVTLAVLLTEGAGPYMLDASGRITLVLGPHPALPGVHLAMGEPSPNHRIGLVRRRVDGPVWEWVVRSDVAPDRRVGALDDLDAVTDLVGAGEWERAARR